MESVFFNRSVAAVSCSKQISDVENLEGRGEGAPSISATLLSIWTTRRATPWPDFVVEITHFTRC